MLAHMEKFMDNLKKYIETSNKTFDSIDSSLIFEMINERNNIYRELYNDNKRIMDTINQDLDSTISKNKFKEYQTYANKLYTFNEQLDCPIASVIHRKLLDIAHEWNDDNLYIQECYYLSSLYYTFDSLFFADKRRKLYSVALKYKEKYFSLDKESRLAFLKLYGNNCLLIRRSRKDNDRDKELRQAIDFKKEYFEFIDQDKVRDLDPDFKYDVFKFSVDANIAGFISDLRYGYKFSKDNFVELRDTINTLYLDRLELCKQSSKPIPSSYEQRYYTMQFFDKKITIHEWEEKIKGLINRMISNPELSYISLNNVYFLETIYLTMLERFSSIKAFDLKKILEEIKSNCYNYLLRIKKDENTISAYNNYLNFCIGLREINADASDIKNSFLNLVRVQSPETYVHIQSVSRLSEIICDSLYEKNPDLFIGCLGTKDLKEVRVKYEKIKSALYDGALLHDTGKSSYLLQILNYYRPLTDEEILLIKDHPIKSYEFVGQTFDKPILEIARYHHLWHNHKGGYPIEDNEIENQLLVDIVAIADSIDAGTDTIGRTYSDAKSLDVLVEELNKEAGTRYSKEVMDALDNKVLDDISNVLYDFKFKIYAKIIDRSNISDEISKLSAEFKVSSYLKNLEEQKKKNKISSDFYDILLEYSRNHQTFSRIKDYVLANLNSINMPKEITAFRKLAILMDDNEGIALSYIFSVWITYSTNLKYAKRLNNYALNCIKSINCYGKKEIYLSYINNSLILANASGDLKEAYEMATKGYELSNGTSYVRYLIAFSNNYSYVLMELGLNKKAKYIIENNLNHFDSYSSYNNLNNLYLYIMVCLLNNCPKTAYSCSKKLIKKTIASGLYSLNMAYCCLLESSLALKNKVIIESAFDKLVEHHTTNENDIEELCLLNEAFAHYYMYKGEYNNAYEYYLKTEPYIEEALGNKKKRYKELLAISKLVGDKDREYKYQEKLNERLMLINEVLKTIVEQSDEVLSEKLTNDTYRVLFESADKLTNFAGAISTTFDLFKIKRLIIDYINHFMDFKTCSLYFINESKAYMRIEEASFSEADTSDSLVNLELSRKEITIYSLGQVSEKVKNQFEENKINHLIVIPLYNVNQKVGVLSIGCIDLDSFYKYQNELRGISSYISQALLNVQTYFKAVFNSNIDYLTKINNRFGLENQINKYFEQNINEYYIIMIDVDHFKSINDRYGHLCGDKVLVDLAKKLVKFFESTNVARMGGEEFVAIYFNSYDNVCKHLDEFMEDIRTTLIEYENQYVSYTISMGAIKNYGFDNFYKGYSKVDDLLYQAKENGRNQYVIKKD